MESAGRNDHVGLPFRSINTFRSALVIHQLGLVVFSSYVVHILMASIQTVRSAEWRAPWLRHGGCLRPVRTLKRRVAGRVRGDRAGRPIEADQYRRYCEAGPVKTRLVARVVPDLDPGPLAREYRPQPSAVSPAITTSSELPFCRCSLALMFTTLLKVTASVDARPDRARGGVLVLHHWHHVYR